MYTFSYNYQLWIIQCYQRSYNSFPPHISQRKQEAILRMYIYTYICYIYISRYIKRFLAWISNDSPCFFKSLLQNVYILIISIYILFFPTYSMYKLFCTILIHRPSPLSFLRHTGLSRSFPCVHLSLSIMCVTLFPYGHGGLSCFFPRDHEGLSSFAPLGLIGL